jgi:hypothetical protein
VSVPEPILEAMTSSAAAAIGMRLLRRVEALVDRQRPDLPPAQRKAIAARLALDGVDGIVDILEHLAARLVSPHERTGP